MFFCFVLCVCVFMYACMDGWMDLCLCAEMHYAYACDTTHFPDEAQALETPEPSQSPPLPVQSAHTSVHALGGTIATKICSDRTVSSII